MRITRWCSGCAEDTAFEPFDCAEHPEECVELVCAGCGEGFELPPVQAAAARRRGRRVSSAA